MWPLAFFFSPMSPRSQPLAQKTKSHHLLLLLPCTQAAVQLLVELRCEQVGGHGSTLPAWQSSSVTSTMLLKQPEKVKAEYENTVNRL